MTLPTRRRLRKLQRGLLDTYRTAQASHAEQIGTGRADFNDAELLDVMRVDPDAEWRFAASVYDMAERCLVGARPWNQWP